jgi:hypothetical protein
MNQTGRYDKKLPQELIFIPCWKTMIKIPFQISKQKILKNLSLLKKEKRRIIFKIISAPYLPDVKNQQSYLLIIFSKEKWEAYEYGNKIKKLLNLDSFEGLKKGVFWVKRYPSPYHFRYETDPKGYLRIKKDNEQYLNMIGLLKKVRQEEQKEEVKVIIED